MPESWVVVKVGGSLFDLPDLGERLQAWLGRLDASRILLVPGGGMTAQAIRTLDRIHHLGEEASHWLAIQAMSVNARFLQELLPSAQILAGIAEARAASSPWHILDPHPFFRADEDRPDHLPHQWQVTSDSLAVRVAALLHARDLILLKSLDWPGTDWSEAKRVHVVDAYFPEALQQAPAAMRIRVVNLRAGAMTP